MITRQTHDPEFPIPLLARKVSLLILFAGLIAVVVVIMPNVATLAPAVHAKELMLRVILAMFIPVFIVAFNSWGKWPVTLVDTAFAGLLATNLISALLSPTAAYSVTQHWQLILLSSVGWALYRLAPTRQELLTALAVTAGVGFLAALYGLLTYAGVDPLRSFYPFQFETEQAGGRNYIHSFFGNPEYFGGFAAPCAFVAASMALQKHLPKWYRLLLLGQSLLILLVIALAGARMALIGIAAASVVSAPLLWGTIPKVLHRRIAAAAVAVGLLGVAGVAILSTSNPLNPREVRLLQRFGQAADLRSDSVRERIVFYTSTADGIGENFIFGNGPGTFRLQFFENLESLISKDPLAGASRLATTLNNRLAEHAHNDYLEFWFENGTVGFAALLFLISLIIYKGMTLFRRPMEPERKHVASMFLGGSVCLLINALTSFPFHMPARGYLAWFLIGGFFAALPRPLELSTTKSGSSAKPIRTPKVN